MSHGRTASVRKVDLQILPCRCLAGINASRLRRIRSASVAGGRADCGDRLPR
jgi:hypothetical protein